MPTQLTREQALEQLQAWTDHPSLLKHARSVEIVMEKAAEELDIGGRSAS
ncbi:MAG: hypothetical protein HQ581_26470 [Planctomycetes bacterium]|nr:hypothetical protein [Planctomycetota bacterium]